MRKVMRRLFKEEGGISAIEYGLIASLIAVAAIGALANMGGSLSDIFSDVDSDLEVEAPADDGTNRNSPDEEFTTNGG